MGFQCVRPTEIGNAIVCCIFAVPCSSWKEKASFDHQDQVWLPYANPQMPQFSEEFANLLQKIWQAFLANIYLPGIEISLRKCQKWHTVNLIL